MKICMKYINLINFRPSKDTKGEEMKRTSKPTFNSPYPKSTSNLLNPYSHFITNPKIEGIESSARDTDSGYNSLPRNFTSSTHGRSWTLLDAEMIRIKGIV